MRWLQIHYAEVRTWMLCFPLHIPWTCPALDALTRVLVNVPNSNKEGAIVFRMMGASTNSTGSKRIEAFTSRWKQIVSREVQISWDDGHKETFPVCIRSLRPCSQLLPTWWISKQYKWYSLQEFFHDFGEGSEELHYKKKGYFATVIVQ